MAQLRASAHHGRVAPRGLDGNPYDNAQCESFMKTLKYEEVLRQEYRDLGEARASIRAFIDEV